MKFLKLSVLMFAMLAVTFSQSYAEFGFSIGLSTPNEKMNDVYNTDKLKLDSITSGSLFRDGAKSGYHILAKMRFDLSENMTFFGGIGWHRFPQTDIQVPDPNDPKKIIATLTTSQNIVPITAGINAYLLRSVVGIYGVGDLSYNYISSSVDLKSGSVSVPYTRTPSDSRVGFGIGAGLDFDMKLLTLNIEAKYNYTNLIGKESSEGDKTYFTLGFGVFF